MHPNEGLERRLCLLWLCGTLGNFPWRNFCRLRPAGLGQSPPLVADTFVGMGGRLAMEPWKLSDEPQCSGPKWFFDAYLLIKWVLSLTRAILERGGPTR